MVVLITVYGLLMIIHVKQLHVVVLLFFNIFGY